MKRGSPFPPEKSTPFKMRKVDEVNQSTPLGKTKFQGELPLSPIRSRRSGSQSLSLSRDMTAELESLGLEEQVQKLKKKLGETKLALDQATSRCNELENAGWGAKKVLSESETANSRKQSRLEEKVIRLESEVEKSGLLLEQEREKAEKMGMANEDLRAKLEEMTQAQKGDKENYSNEIAEWKEKVKEFQEDMVAKEAEYDEELDAADQDQVQFKATERKLKLRFKAMKGQRDELEEQCRLLEDQNDRLIGVEEDLREELVEANTKLREITAGGQGLEEVVNEAGDSMDALISDVTELEKRKQEIENLKIEMESLREWKKDHLEINEKFLAAKNEVARLEIRVEELEACQEEGEEAKERWEALERSLNGNASSETITASEVVEECSQMKEKIASLEHTNNRLEEENSRLKKSLDLSANHAELIQENITLQNQNSRLQAEVDLLSASRNETRELLRSISSEKGLPEDHILVSFDSLAQKSQDLFEQKMDLLVNEKIAVGKELSSCQKTMEEMGQRIEELEGRVNRGEFNPATTKVLHLAINPSNTANTRDLLMKLRESEEPASMSSSSSSSSRGLGSIEKLAENPQVKAILRRMKTKHDSELDLIKRKFRQKISEFRMAVYWVFGWRFDAEAETGPKKRRYRLRSMYSTDGDVLMLEVGETGSLELLQSDFGEQVMNGPAGELLRESGSIPAFLSQVILDLR